VTSRPLRLCIHVAFEFRIVQSSGELLATIERKSRNLAAAKRGKAREKTWHVGKGSARNQGVGYG
jgi:hypothetical protein